MKEKTVKLSPCGIDCTKCDAYIATKLEDFTAKEKIAQAWSEVYGTSFSPDEITCEGCTEGGRVINHWHDCHLRICGKNKMPGIEETSFMGCCQKSFSISDHTDESKSSPSLKVK